MLVEYDENKYIGNSRNHHRGAKVTTDFMLDKWKNGEWLNNFVSKSVTVKKSSTDFPSVDKEFDDIEKKTIIACEFKPSTESKRGILTGLGQAIAYLNAADASYLICPSRIDGFDMEDFLKQTFDRSVKGKIPVGLIVFDGHFNEYKNIRLSVDISENLKSTNIKLQQSKVAPWAIWRDNPAIGIVRLVESGAIDELKTGADRWAYFFNTFYAPDKVKSLDVVENDLYIFSPDKYHTPFSTHKKRIKQYLGEKLTYQDILKRYKEKKYRLHYLDGISTTGELKESDYMRLLANHSWNPEIKENIFQNYKKNYKNFVVHTNLVDNEFKATPQGARFVERCKNIIDSVKDISVQSKKINDELAQIILVPGKHYDLILDINLAQDSIKRNLTGKEVLESYVKFFDKKGFLPRNINRKTSGDRGFLQSEKQIWKHLGFLEAELTANNYFRFDMTRIEGLIDDYFDNYGDVYKLF